MTNTSLAPLDALLDGRPIAPLEGRLDRGRPRVPDLRDALHRVLAGRPVHSLVRPEIVASWRRAESQGLRPDEAAPGYDDGSDADTFLSELAAPVLTALGHDLVDTDASVLVANDRGRIIGRYGPGPTSDSRLDRLGVGPGFVWDEAHLGTNGVGTAIERGGATLVAGDEHFADRLVDFCTGGAPIVEPRSGRTVGVVAIVRHAHEASRLMLTVARQA